MQEAGVEVEHDVAVRAHDQPAVAGERAEVGQLHTVDPAALAQLAEAVRVDRHDHPFLRFRQPDLPRFEARVLERHEVELDVGTDAVGHLADRRRQPTGPAVGDRRVEILGTDQHVDQQLLGDRVADLHARSGDRAGGGVHRQRRERRAADPVAAGAATEHDDAVARVRAGEGRTIVGDTDAPGEHQRVGGVGGVVQHGAGDGRQTDLVAVVGDAVDHALADPQRVEGAVGDVGERDVGRPEAQDVGDRDRAVGGAEHVADHAADTGVGAAERFDRRRVVVGLGLEGDRRARPVGDDARVADERRPHERRGDGVRAAPQHGEQRRPFVAGVGHERRPERLVRAVLAPRLGDGLELDVGRITALGDEVMLHGQQLVGIEGERPIDTDLLERGSATARGPERRWRCRRIDHRT